MGVGSADRAAIDWLLSSEDAAIRYLVRRDLLGEASDRQEVLASVRVQRLLEGQQADGSFGVPPYQKWTGAHWRLVSLVELGLPERHQGAVAALDTVLDWLASDTHRRRIANTAGLTRRCASQEGNAVAVACRLGRSTDPRVGLLATSLIEWQWPDGGWNCDKRAGAHRSSFHESLIPMWALHEYATATGVRSAAEAARRTAELLLDHHLFKSLRTGQAIHREWTTLHYPPYWRYDILQALVVLSRMSLARDERAAEALNLIEARRLPDGRWRSGGRWWKPPGATGSGVEVVDWGRTGPNEMITLNALRVLNAAGRLADL
jgi:hypothetical protein